MLQLFKNLLCKLFGHKPAQAFFDPAAGDVRCACPRCFTLLKEADLLYPEDLPNASPGIAHGPLTLPAAGEVVCSGCGHAWHSYHALAEGPVLCSPCREALDKKEREKHLA